MVKGDSGVDGSAWGQKINDELKKDGIRSPDKMKHQRENVNYKKLVICCWIATKMLFGLTVSRTWLF